MDFLIADRTFSSIDNVVKNIEIFGGILNKIYKMFLFENSENTKNYLLSKMPKLLLYDPNDEIIKDFSSIKSDISGIYLDKKFKKSKKKSFLEYCLSDDNDNSNSNNNTENFIELLYLISNHKRNEKSEIIKDFHSFFNKFQKDLIKEKKNSLNNNRNRNTNNDNDKDEKNNGKVNSYINKFLFFYFKFS